MDLWLACNLKKKKWTGSDAVWLLRDSCTRPCSFCLVSWDTGFWSPCHLLRGAAHQAAGELRGETTDKHLHWQLPLMSQLTAGIHGQHVTKATSRWLYPQLSNYPTSWVSPSEGWWESDKIVSLCPSQIHDQENPNFFLTCYVWGVIYHTAAVGRTHLDICTEHPERKMTQNRKTGARTVCWCIRKWNYIGILPPPHYEPYCLLMPYPNPWPSATVQQ